MEFKLAIGDPASKRTYKASLKDADAEKLVGKKIGEKFKGELMGLGGYELQITGGSDNAGFPMRADIGGPTRKKVILTGGVGFHSHRKGLRRRKSVRGNTISTDIVQVNCKVVKAGSKKLAEVFGVSEKPKEGEAPAEKKEEAKPEEPKKKEAPKEKPVENKAEKEAKKEEKLKEAKAEEKKIEEKKEEK